MQSVLILAVALAFTAAGFIIHPAHGAGTAMVRVAHASPNAPAVDVYVDGARAFADLMVEAKGKEQAVLPFLAGRAMPAGAVHSGGETP